MSFPVIFLLMALAGTIRLSADSLMVFEIFLIVFSIPRREIRKRPIFLFREKALFPYLCLQIGF